MSHKTTSLIPSSSLIAELTNSTSEEWTDYTQHQFVQKIAERQPVGRCVQVLPNSRLFISHPICQGLWPCCF